MTKEELKEDDTMSLASEMTWMILELARHSADRSVSLDRKVIEYRTRIITELIYEDE